MIKLTQEQIGKLMHMGGSIFTPEQCIEYAEWLPEGTTLDDIENDIDFLEAYDNEYFVCTSCSWPFENIDIVDNGSGEFICKGCNEELIE